MAKTTIKVRHQNGNTVVSNDKGSEWSFGGRLDNETAIASIVFFTILRNFDSAKNISDDFEIELTMEIRDNSGKNFPTEHKAEMHMKIEDCGLSVRATNCCKAAGLKTVGDIVKLHPSDLLKFRNFGMKSIVELKEKIESLGIKWN